MKAAQKCLYKKKKKGTGSTSLSLHQKGWSVWLSQDALVCAWAPLYHADKCLLTSLNPSVGGIIIMWES